MREKILGYFLAGLQFLVVKILVIDLGLFALVAASFLVWGPYDTTALSERLVLTGLAVGMIAGLLAFSQTTGGRNFGIPGQFMGSVHGQSVIDFNIQARQDIEGRMGFLPRMFVVGLILFVTGALIQSWFT